MGGDESSDRSRAAPWIVAGITLAVFLPAVFNDFVDWDDPAMIVQNPRFNPPTWSGLGRCWTTAQMDMYMPLTQTIWAGIANIAKLRRADENGNWLNPYMFHLASVLAHATSAVLAYFLLRQMLFDPIAAAAGATLFALHVVQVEAVAWASGLKDVLSGMFCLAALLAWITQARRPTMATIFFLLALLSKPNAVALPIVAAVLEIFALGRPIKATIARLLPWIVLTVFFIVVADRAQPAPFVKVPIHLRPLIAVDALSFYLRKIFGPGLMGIDYGRTPQVALSMNVSLSFVAVIALATFVIAARRRMPIVTGAVAVFAAGVLPVLGLVRFDFQKFSTVADHYVYFAMLGPALATAWVVAKCGKNPVIRIPFAIAVFIVFAVMIVRTEVQIRTWRNGETLFRNAIAVNPRSWVSYSNLANVVADRAPDEAIEYCRRALQIQPDDAGSWNNLGSVLMKKGESAAALDAFGRAHQLAPDNPVFSDNYRRATATTR